MSAVGRTKAPCSLLVFVQALEGLTLLLELRNDTVVRGRVESVDDAMKCVRCARLQRDAITAALTPVCRANSSASSAHMHAASSSPTPFVRRSRCAATHNSSQPHLMLVAQQGRRSTLPSVFIRGRLIRFIHLPESLDPELTVQAHRRRLADAALSDERRRARGARNPPSGGRAASQDEADGAGGGGT